jgi:uncharacterized protein YcfL
MNRLRWLLLSSFLMAGCASDKPVAVKQKEEALHRGLSEAAKKADPAKNLKEASDAIRTFKISDAADAGFKKHQVKNQEHKQARTNTPDKPDSPSQPSQATHPERKSP